MRIAYNALMQAIGICVRYQANQPTVNCVVLAGTIDEPALIKSFDLKTDAERIPAQLRALAKALNSQLTGMQVDVAVIRIADVGPIGNREAARRNRLLIEGALALTCEQNTADRVHLRNGKEIGESLGVTKEASCTAGKKVDSKRFDAAAAALSGLPGGDTTAAVQP
jgi:hypothetical protein